MRAPNQYAWHFKSLRYHLTLEHATHTHKQFIYKQCVVHLHHRHVTGTTGTTCRDTVVKKKDVDTYIHIYIYVYTYILFAVTGF